MNHHSPQQRQEMQTQSMIMGTSYDDIPIREPGDLEFISKSPFLLGRVPSSQLFLFEYACRHGPVSALQSTIVSGTNTPAFLHHGLTYAISAGNTDTTQYLLARGAPILRVTPDLVLSAPPDQQIPLFEFLTQHSWNPNVPGYYGEVLLPKVISNPSLLVWFITHGADPNLGTQRDNRDRLGLPDTDSCAALESAAAHGTVEAVKILLDAGARVHNGTPLQCASAATPPGTNPLYERARLSKEFDAGRIPIMELLVDAGVDVNYAPVSRLMTPRYAIVHAVIAGAVERVRWLLSKGGNPHATGAYGSAAEYAAKFGSDEMKRVIEEGIVAKKWAEIEGMEQEDQVGTIA
ncbi:ankyrin repeat-containing domain protein [Mariannaea sp. PMI_226]|nr:ankyrin repeat-containing domain protein [Mariannaea sp. PMI_226]